MTDQPLEPEEPRPEGSAASSAPASEAASSARTAEPEATTRPPRRLLRSRADRLLAGVCGGLGRYLGVDPILVRIGAIVLVLAGGAGIVLYLIGWIAIPNEPPGVAAAAARGKVAPGDRASGAVALGLAFVALGALFLADAIWPDFLTWRYLWPLALIVLGAAILVRART